MILRELALWWPQFLGVFSVLLSLCCSCHVVLNKRDPRAATGWVGVIWLTPLVGSFLYLLLGINRVRRLAKTFRQESPLPLCHESPEAATDGGPARLFPENPSLESLARLGASVTRRPLLHGNAIFPLENGDNAYPQMLKAIEGAQRSITLSTYIFDNDRVGAKFIEALAQAVARSIQVRVLIDDVGLRYSWRSVLKQLKKGKIPVARFMGALRPRTFPHLNLRKHRKILICDGAIAFTGGMNLREGHVLSESPKHAVQDLHFRIEGPLVSQLQEVFAEDWAFTAKEILSGPLWFKEATPAAGDCYARAISDGPDEDLNKLPLIISGAVASAQKSVWILTPYFLPDAALVSALYVAANKGISVNLILPQNNNLPFVQWAANPLLPSLLDHGCRIWFSKPPFDHSKLMLVDETWALFGSANWDPRSLRLNFELNVEAYDAVLGRTLMELIRKKLEGARPLRAADLRNRPLPLRLRDGVARLFSPYL